MARTKQQEVDRKKEFKNFKRPTMSKVVWAYATPKKIQGHDLCNNPLFLYLAEELSGTAQQAVALNRAGEIKDDRLMNQAFVIQDLRNQLRASQVETRLYMDSYTRARAEVAVLEDQVARMQEFIQGEYHRLDTPDEENKFYQRLHDNQVHPSFLNGTAGSDSDSEVSIDLLEDDE